MEGGGGGSNKEFFYLESFKSVSPGLLVDDSQSFGFHELITCPTKHYFGDQRRSCQLLFCQATAFKVVVNNDSCYFPKERTFNTK